MKLDDFARQKINDAYRYIQQHDQEFRFYIDPIAKSLSPAIKQLDILPSLNRYRILDTELQELNRQPFSSVLPYSSIADKYLKLLYDDQKVLFNLNNTFRAQSVFRSEMVDALTFLRSIQDILKNSFAIMKKQHFMQLLLREVKVFNQKVHHLVHSSTQFASMPFLDTIDILHYSKVAHPDQQFQLQDAISVISLFLDRAITILSQQLLELQRTQRQNHANRALQLGASLSKLLQEQGPILTQHDSLFNHLNLLAYTDSSKLIDQCLQELSVLEPFLLRINEVSAELVYLSYILKSEIKTLKADSQSLTAKRCDDLLTRIKDKLHFRKHFGETGYFVGAISIKMEKRTLELKSLKQQVLEWKAMMQRIAQVEERKPTTDKLLALSQELTTRVQKQQQLDFASAEEMFKYSTDICIQLHDELAFIEEDCLYPSETMKKNNQQILSLFQQLGYQIEKQYRIQDTLAGELAKMHRIMSSDVTHSERKGKELFDFLQLLLQNSLVSEDQINLYLGQQMSDQDVKEYSLAMKESLAKLKINESNLLSLNSNNQAVKFSLVVNREFESVISSIFFLIDGNRVFNYSKIEKWFSYSIQQLSGYQQTKKLTSLKLMEEQKQEFDTHLTVLNTNKNQNLSRVFECQELIKATIDSSQFQTYLAKFGLNLHPKVCICYFFKIQRIQSLQEFANFSNSFTKQHVYFTQFLGKERSIVQELKLFDQDSILQLNQMHSIVVDLIQATNLLKISNLVQFAEAVPSTFVESINFYQKLITKSLSFDPNYLKKLLQQLQFCSQFKGIWDGLIKQFSDQLKAKAAKNQVKQTLSKIKETQDQINQSLSLIGQPPFSNVRNKEQLNAMAQNLNKEMPIYIEFEKVLNDPSKTKQFQSEYSQPQFKQLRDTLTKMNAYLSVQ